MKKKIAFAIKKAKEQNWITINEHLNEDALVLLFIEAIKDMPVRDFLEDSFSGTAL